MSFDIFAISITISLLFLSLSTEENKFGSKSLLVVGLDDVDDAVIIDNENAFTTTSVPFSCDDSDAVIRRI
jgi:hypothetical protein